MSSCLRASCDVGASPRSTGAAAPSLRRLTAAVLGMLLLAVGVVGASPPPEASAALQKAFAPVFSTEENGAISIVGNSQMSCPSSSSACTAARARSGTGAALNNNNYTMAFSDVDDNAATTNSTSAQVALPTGSSVLYARLIWSARLDAGGNGVAASGSAGVAKLRSPTQFAYSTVTATTVTTPSINTHPYQASLDVTSTVQAGGNGTYWFADMAGGTGSDTYAGWTLVIAYKNSSLPLRNLTVFEGFADISNTTGNSSVSTTVSGFLTPASGTVNATVGVGAWEGDLGSDGDQLKFNGTTLSDATRPATNFFSSSISNYGIANADKNPSYSNNLGVDLGRISANGVLPNGATSATVDVLTTNETVYLGLVTTEIDLYTPAFAGISKSVTDLNGNAPAQVGDTLEYRLSFTNSGDDTATSVLVRDPLPANLTYVPGSIVVLTGANASTTPKTDDPGDDVAEYDSASRSVRARLGTGADATSGGTVAPAGVSSVRFQATLDPASAGTVVTNGGFLDYRAQTLNRSYTFTTNTVDTPVRGLADLAVTQVSSPTTQTAGSAVTYTSTVTNAGPDTASAVVTTDTLPAGVTFSTLTLPTGTTCSVNGQTVTCTTTTIASGASISIPVTAVVAAGTAAGTVVSTTTVSSSTSDDVTSNNTATASTTITRSADLALTNTGASSAVAGSQPTYTLKVTDNGPSSATATSVSDTLPTGLTLVSATPSQGSCSANGQVVTCVLGTVAPAGTATVALKVAVAASYTGASIANTATVSSTTPDAIPANNTASRTVAITQDADVAVTTAVTPATAVAGTVVTYTVTVADLAGGSDARGVVLSDTLPSGLTLLQATPTQGTCTSTSPVSCALGLITPGSSAQVSLSVRVGSTTSAGTVASTATATTTTAQSVTTNDADTATLAVTTRADLSLTKTASPNPVQLGTDLTYTLTAANDGPSQARGVVVTDTLPPGTTFVGGSSGCVAVGQLVTCTVGTLEVGGSAVRTVTVTTPQSAPGSTLTNTATVAGATADASTDDNTATFVSGTRSSADLSLTAATGPATVVAGRDVVYTLTARNDGPSAAAGVRVLDTLPTGVGYVSSSIAGAGSCSLDGQDVSCALGALAGGSSVVVTVVGHVDPDLTTTSTSSTASVSASSPTDPTTSNNADTSTAAVSRSADVAVALVTVDPTVRAGAEATYRVVVSNAGPSSARGEVVTVQLPDGLTTVPASLPDGCTAVGRTLTCALATLAADAATSLTFRALVAPRTPAGTVTTSVSAGGTTPDPGPGNDSATAPLGVVTVADLAVDATVSPATPVAGSAATYTLTATDLGPSDATAVTLVDTVPAGSVVTTVDPSAGTCTVTGQQVSCAVARLAPGGVLTVRVVVAVDPGATGSTTDAVTIASGVDDPAPANNAAVVAAEVVRSADLRLTQTATPSPVVAGGTVRYTLTAVDAGPSVALAVVLDDTLPAGARLLAGSVDAPPGVGCTLDLVADRVTCALGDLVPGASRSVTVEASVPSTAVDGSTLDNTASLASPTPSADPGTRTASTTTPVTTRADLEVSAASRSESPVAGAQETYLLGVTNAGPSVARSATVVETLPDALSLASALDPEGACTASGRQVTCSLGDLDPGQVVVVQITVDVDPGVAGTTVETSARVSSSTDDPTSSNDSATLDQPVSAQNDLTLTEEVTSGAVVAGQPVTYRVVLTNGGPSRARDVALADVLPDRLGYAGAVASAGGRCGYDEAAQTPADDDRVTCRWDTLDVGGTVTATVTLTVPADQPTDEPLVNTATATSDATDPSPATATATSPVGSRADLSLHKTLLSGAPTAGQEVRWQLAVANAGPSTARAVHVADVAPAGVTFTAAESAQGACPVTAQALTCTLDDLAVGGAATVTVSGTVASDFSGEELTNTATVGSTTPDPDAADNTSSLTSPALVSADLSLTATAAPEVLTAGAEVTWTVRLGDDGPSTAQDVVLVDDLPAGVTPVSSTLDGSGTCSGTRTVVCAVDRLDPGSGRVLTVVGRLSADYRASSVVSTAHVSAATSDPDPLDDAVTTTSAVGQAADLSVSQTGPSTVTAGDTIAWRVAVADAGPSDATGVVLVDELPADLLGATATVPGGGCSVTGRVLTCAVGVVPAGGSVVVTVSARVDPASTAQDVTNAVSVTSATADPDQDDLGAELTTTVTRSADLSVATTATSARFTPGEPVGWVLTVRSSGPSVGRAVTVEDLVPDGVGDVAVESDGAECRLVGRVLSCVVADVVPGTPVQVRLGGTLAPGYGGASLVNTATLRDATPDPVPGDDEAVSDTPVLAAADLSVTKALTSGRPVAGAPVGWTLRVHDAGPSDAHEVVLTDAVPTTVEDLGVTTDAGACSFVAHDLTCRLGDLAAGGDAEVLLTGTVGPGYAGELDNTAGVVSATADPEPLDDVATSASSVTGSADLALGASGPDGVVAGERASWRLMVTNAGPSTARDVALVDAVPAGVGAVRLETAAGSCDPARRRCLLGDLAVGDSVVVTVSGLVAADHARTTLVNVASVTSATADPRSADNTARSTTTVSQEADLVVTKTSDPVQLVPGTDATYTVTVADRGPSTAQLVSVTDELPDGVDLRAGGPTSDTGSCATDGRTVGCEVGQLAPGDTAQVRIPVTVQAGYTGSSIVNTAVARSATPEVDGTDDTATATSPTAGSADLTLRQTAPAEVRAGTPLGWQLELRNDGPSAAQGTVLTATLPPGVGAVDLSTSQGSCSQAGREISCPVGVLVDGGTVRVLVTVRGGLDPSYAPGDITSTAHVTSTTAEPDTGGDGGPVADGRDAAATTTVVASADLSVTKVAQGAAVAGGPVAWTITLADTGPSTARDVRLRDPGVPGLAGFTLTPPAGVSCVDDLCSVDTLLPGPAHALVFTAGATVPADSAATALTNTATASTATDDPDPGDDRATAEVRVTRSAAVSITKTGPADVVPGRRVSWTLRAGNAGPSLARGVVVDDLLPTAVTGIEVSPPDGTTCSTGPTLSCTVGDLGAGDDAVITVSGVLAADVTDTVLSNTATVLTTVPDPDVTDDSSTAVSDVTPKADLRVTKSGPASVTAGGAVSWLLGVANRGPSQARDVVLTDALPAGVEQVAAGSTEDGVGCTVTEGVVRCTVADLAPGARRTVTVSGVVDPEELGATLTNTATVTSDVAELDPSDNTSLPVVTAVTRSADVSIAAAVAPDPVEAGRPATFTLTVRDAGPSTARRVHLVDLVPEGMSVGTVTSTAGTCAVQEQLVRCDLGLLAPTGDTPVVVTIPVAVGDDLPPDGTDTASVTADDPDPDLTNNTARVTGHAASTADLSLTKRADRPAAVPGGDIGWTIAVHNDGPATARRVVVLDDLPDGLTGLSASTTTGACDLQAGLTCRLGDLPDGATATVTVSGRVAADDPAASVVNSASLTSGTADPHPGDDVDQAVTPLAGSADLALTKTTDTTTVVAGGPVRWTLSASNAGPSVAHGVLVTDVLPATPSTDLPAGCTAVGRTVRCDLGTVPVGARVDRVIDATVDASQSAPLSNTATISSAAPDPDPADNTATTPPAPVSRVADVAVGKTVEDPSVAVGDRVVYHVRVSSAGPSDATGVGVQERWPAGVRLVSADATAGAYDAGTQRWRVGTLVPGQVEELTLVGTVTEDAGLHNEVTLVAPTEYGDPQGADDVAAADVRVTGTTDGSSGSGHHRSHGSGLAGTGGPSAWLTLAGALAVLAGGALLVSRRRRRG